VAAPEQSAEKAQAKLSVSQILACTASEYVATYPGQAVPQVQSTLAKLSLCRTAALGARQLQCGQCRYETIIYNSCGDRHCSQCAGAKRSDWIDASESLILAGVDHYQVVFTLPAELSRLSLGNRRQLYSLLFNAAWSALKQTIEAEQGFDPAALMVLHTWNQKLEPHAHVHAVVPGGGPALVDGQWKDATAPDGRSTGWYLVDAVTLRRTFREHFIKGLRRLFAKGELKLEGEFAHLLIADEQEALLAELEAVEWVSYIEPPPHEGCRPEAVLKYLARYLTGGPISDARIISADEQQVTFLAREGKITGGQREQVPITLSSVEFTRYWSMHILPKGFTKSRCFGGWSNCRKGEYIQCCAMLLEDSTLPLSPKALTFDPSDFEPSLTSEEDCKNHLCPKCGAAMSQTSATLKRSWRDIMNSSYRPNWYSHIPPRL
jgi:Putative transposase/Transposase zinc-binding domain